MPVEDAGREQPAVAHEVQQRLDERAEVLHHRRERRRRLQPGDHLAERAEEGRLAAGERRQRTFDDEVHQHHARLFVGVVHGRRDAGVCRGAQTRIAAPRVSEAVPVDLEPQQVHARASVDPQRRGARRAAGRRTDPGDGRRVSDRRDRGECRRSAILGDRGEHIRHHPLLLASPQRNEDRPRAWTGSDLVRNLAPRTGMCSLCTAPRKVRMARELVYTGFMSLDGVVDSPGGTAEGHRSGGWVMDTEFVPEAFALKGEELDDTTALMFGRRSYEVLRRSGVSPRTMRPTRISRSTSCRRPSPMTTCSTAGVRPRSCDPATTSPARSRTAAAQSSSTAVQNSPDGSPRLI